MSEYRTVTVCPMCGGQRVTTIIGYWIDVHCYGCGQNSNNRVGFEDMEREVERE